MLQELINEQMSSNRTMRVSHIKNLIFIRHIITFKAYVLSDSEGSIREMLE
jgi:hypothetical protein